VTRAVQAGTRPGATTAEARRWFQSRGIEPYWDFAQISDRYEAFGYRKGQLSGIVSGRIPETNYDFLMAGDLQINLFFDKQGRLIDSAVTEEWLGP
jgi:hypothetical protein